MYTPRSSLSKTPLSVSKTQRTFGSGRRSGTFFTPASRRSPYAPSFIQPRNQSLSRSFQTSVIEETAQHIVEAYGTPLPVLVTEAVTLAERVADVSVRLQSSGWACLVCGRRLFIWKYKQDIGSRNMVAHCRELTLPPSDLAHKAELVHVLTNKESQMPSALAVSPEGIVRYWPNIAHEGSSVEAAADLQGQECYSLTNVLPLGCILATTTSSLVLITPSAADGQHTILCHTLKVPQGVLAGIGRRVSSFIFGAMPTQSSETKQLNKVLSADGLYGSEKFLFVLSGCTVQKWHLIEDEPDKLIYECDLDRYVKEGFLDALWNRDSTHLHQLKTWCLDMQLTRTGVVILCAGMNSNVSQQIFYAFGIFETSGIVPASGFASFCIIKHSEHYHEQDEEKLLGYKFIFPSVSGQYAYICSANKVMCVSVMSSTDEPDIVEFSNNSDVILGAGTCDGLPLFFTQFHGLVSLQSTQASLVETSTHQTFHKEVFKDLEGEEVTEHLPTRLRSAMLLYCNGELAKSQKAIDDLFPSLTATTSGGDYILDDTVATLSLELIDDYPASDPRWVESVPTGDSVSSSLIILHQLEDKLKAHEFLLNFLKASGLWDRLSTLKVRDTPISTCLLLCEHAEKVIAAKAIRRFHIDYNNILDTVMKTVQKKRIDIKNHLTHQDMFYREVSSVNILIPALMEWEENQLKDDVNSQDILNIVGTVNNIFVGIFQSVIQYRQSKAVFFNQQENISKAEYIPWTSTEGTNGLRTLLIKQHSINVEHTLNMSDDLQIQGAFIQQVMDIVDFVLNGYKCQLESLQGKDRYSSVETKYLKDRNQLIQPLLSSGQIERAASLAEKYNDFDILVQLCEDTNNQERLQRYMLQFKDEGFSDFVFKWYLDKGKRGKLLLQPIGHQAELARFLQGHDNISWLHHVHSSQYVSAQQTLKELALKENQYLSKKKTLLSLSKLTALASDVPLDIKNSQTQALNSELDLIMHQESLPASVAEAFGLDPDTMRVLSPEELIEMYVSEDNSAVNHYDFKIALDLLEFIKKPPGDNEVENLRLHIWCKAVLRDNWEDLDVNNPLEAIKDTIFFRVIELAFDQGIDLHDFLPHVDHLLQSPELTCLADNTTFAFLLRAGYEHVMKLMD